LSFFLSRTAILHCTAFQLHSLIAVIHFAGNSLQEVRDSGLVRKTRLANPRDAPPPQSSVGPQAHSRQQSKMEGEPGGACGICEGPVPVPGGCTPRDRLADPGTQIHLSS
jgi:hypothetical protein